VRIDHALAVRLALAVRWRSSRRWRLQAEPEQPAPIAHEPKVLAPPPSLQEPATAAPGRAAWAVRLESSACRRPSRSSATAWRWDRSASRAATRPASTGPTARGATRKVVVFRAPRPRRWAGLRQLVRSSA